MAETLEILWGAEAIARAINRSEHVTYRLLENGQLPPARKVGKRWCVSRQALKRTFDPSHQEGERAHA